MWRRLNEEEKKNLLANYQFGAYLVRFLMGGWLLFITIVYIFGIQNAVESLAQGDYFSGVGSMLGGAMAAILLYGIPILLILRVGTEEIRLLKNDEIYLGSALFVSGGRSIRVLQKDRAVRYFAKVKLLDEWGNACQQIECRSIGDLRRSCKEGDRISVLKIPKMSGDELISMKKKLI
jgi:hypothetical protein